MEHFECLHEERWGKLLEMYTELNKNLATKEDFTRLEKKIDGNGKISLDGMRERLSVLWKWHWTLIVSALGIISGIVVFIFKIKFK